MDSEMGLSGKTVLVVGTGISGIAAVNLLATQSANIILLDGNTELSPETVAAKFSEDIHYDLILEDDLPQTGQQEADFGLTQRHKALLAGDLNAHGEDARDRKSTRLNSSHFH